MISLSSANTILFKPHERQRHDNTCANPSTIERIESDDQRMRNGTQIVYILLYRPAGFYYYYVQYQVSSWSTTGTYDIPRAVQESGSGHVTAEAGLTKHRPTEQLRAQKRAGLLPTAETARHDFASHNQSNVFNGTRAPLYQTPTISTFDLKSTICLPHYNTHSSIMSLTTRPQTNYSPTLCVIDGNQVNNK